MVLFSARASAAGDSSDYDFDIQAQPLAEALLQLAEQSGNMIVAPSSLTTGKSAPALKGRMSATSALRMLLEGFSLRYVWRDQTTIVILSANDGAVMSAGPEPPAAARTAASERLGNAHIDSPLDAIVVTGSLIGDPNLSKSTPVTVIDQQEIKLRQSNTAEELMSSLPGAVPGTGSAVSNQTYGPSTLNLHGLGENRNLVLLDGARMTPWGVDASVDLNDIPLALLDRVEMLTGGATTTYGADAVAGVVNYITRKDFSGVEADTSDQIDERGDGNTVRAELTIGGALDDARLHAVLSIGYQDAHGLYRTDRALAENGIDSFTGAIGTSPITVPGIFYLPGTGLQQLNTSSGALAPVTQLYNANGAGVLETPFRRDNAYGAAQYGITDDVEIYGQAFYVKSLVDAPFSASGTAGVELDIPYSNAYLPVATRDQFCAANGLSAAQCAAAAAATNPSDPNYRTFSTDVYRRFLEGGRTRLDFDTHVAQIRMGVRGSLASHLKFDVFGIYGQSENTDTVSSNALFSRLQQGVLAASTTACFDTSRGCVPIDLFGPAGSVTAAQIAFLEPTASTIRLSSVFATMRAVVNGDLGIASPLADTPVGIAIGSEYRRYAVMQSPDALSSTVGELLGDGTTVAIAGEYHVQEEFLELIAPILENRPFIKHLSLETGARESDYSTLGTDFTWKVGGSWEPVDGLKLRASHQLAARAPNIGELYTPQTATYDSLNVDPCAGDISPTSSIGKICIAQGAPRSALGSITTAPEVNAVAGGNPNLKAEIAHTLTVGIDYRPAQFQNLTASVDYYHIRVDNAITAPTIGDVIASCFSPSSNPTLAVTPACTSIRRDPVSGELDGSFATTPGIPEILSNDGRMATSGFDWAVSQRFSLPSGSLQLALTGNYTQSATFQSAPDQMNRQCVGYYSANCVALQPRMTWDQRSTYTIQGLEFSLLWRHISPMRYEPQALIDESGSGDSPLSMFTHIAAYNYLDYTASWRLSNACELTFIIHNLTDKSPPIVGSTIGDLAFNTANTYPATYDVMGRRYGLSLRVRF